MNSFVNLVSITPNAESLIAYCARVSSDNQNNPEYEKLLTYCIKHSHWSVFEQAHMTLEIHTSIAISAQILRHKSFNFQQFSARYNKLTEVIKYEAREQDLKNRQNSTDTLSQDTKDWFNAKQRELSLSAMQAYNEALDKGIAKECARMLLPLGTKTKMYMNGNIRSWITYMLVRLDKSTQLEHREIAQQSWEIFKTELPVISNALKTLYPEIFT